MFRPTVTRNGRHITAPPCIRDLLAAAPGHVFAGVLLVATVLAALQANAQDTSAPEQAAAPVLAVALPADAGGVESFRRAIGGDDAAGFAGQTRSELSVTVAPMPRDELESRTESALGYLRRVATALSQLIIEWQRAERDGTLDDDAKRALQRRQDLILDFRNDLAAHATILIDAAEAKGAELSDQRRYVTVVTNIEVPNIVDDDTLDQGERAALQVIRRVREEPPVHERPDPWTVPVTELVEELQPLRREELDERVEAWLKILQRQVRQRIRMDIALGKTEVAAEKDIIAKLAAEQQQTITDTVESLQAVLDVYAKRGGDTSLALQYIANATGQRINIRDPAVFYAQAKAWALSPSGGLKLASNVGRFLAILFVTWIIARILGRIVRIALRRLPKASSLLQDFLIGGVRRVVMLIGLLVAVSALGINITPLAAAIGAAGLVIGLALQGTLSNFASGILILMYRPFDVGDVVNAGGVFGKVDTMTLVSTRILTFDNQVNWVPNDAIWNNVITNATALQTRRVDMVFGIGYGDDMGTAQSIIEEAVAEHPKVLPDPAPTIRVNELGDNSVNFVVRPWALTSDYWDVYWDLVRTVKERFDAAGINIPFPQRDLHVSGPIEVVLNPEQHRARDAGAPRVATTVAGSQPPSTEPGPAGQDEDDDA